MECPECRSQQIRKNGRNKGKQNYICADCGRQFIADYNAYQGYSDEFKRECLKLYVNGMGARALERVKGVHHTTVITWVKPIGELLPDTYEPEKKRQVGALDELETFVGTKKAAATQPSSHGEFSAVLGSPQVEQLTNPKGGWNAHQATKSGCGQQ